MKQIPVLNVQSKTLASAYEAALLELYTRGCRFKTQYDKPEDPMSLDATMNITVEEPLADPMIHKAFPGGIEDLREYVMELEGHKDHWVKNLGDDKDTRWEYTYHGRFKNYGGYKGVHGNPESVYDGGDIIDQIEAVIDKLSKQPFTRQAQMITWCPMMDLDIFDPPCIQSWWGRILEEDDVYYLNYNIRIRSNDAWGAYFFNSFGLTMMTKELIADEIAKRTGKIVRLGRMNWHADSWHVYGKDIEQFQQRLVSKLAVSQFEDRVYNFNDEMIQEIYHEATPVVMKKIAEYDGRK